MDLACDPSTSLRRTSVMFTLRTPLSFFYFILLILDLSILTIFHIVCHPEERGIPARNSPKVNYQSLSSYLRRFLPTVEMTRLRALRYIFAKVLNFDKGYKSSKYWNLEFLKLEFHSSIIEGKFSFSHLYLLRIII